MLSGIGIFGGFGASYGGQQIAFNNIHDQTQVRVDHLKEKIDAGIVDPQRLQSRLERRYGDAAAGIVGQDGSVDFSKLVDVITQARSSRLQDGLTKQFGPDAAGIVGTDGTIDIQKLRSLVADKLVEKVNSGDINLRRLQRRLTFQYGDAAKGVFNQDGSVNTDALRALITGSDSSQQTASTSTAAPTVDQQVKQILSDLTGQDGNIDPSKLVKFVVDQLKQKVDSGQLAPGDLGNLLTQQFGDAANGIVGSDGTINYDALQSLLSNSTPDALQGFLTAGFGDSAKNVVNADGTINQQALSDFLTAQLNQATDPNATTTTASTNQTGSGSESSENDGSNEASDSSGEDTSAGNQPGNRFAFSSGGLSELRNLLGLLGNNGHFGGLGFAFGRHGFGHNHSPFFNVNA